MSEDALNIPIKIKPKFKEFTPYLIGNPRQFFVDRGRIICVRDTSEGKHSPCEDCFHNQTCSNTQIKISTVPIPQARRAIALEETPFLVLRIKPYFTINPNDISKQQVQIGRASCRERVYVLV